MIVETYLWGWWCAVLFFVFLIILIIEKIKLQRTIVDLKKYHKDYVTKQIVDLRKICHNINTPLNSIIVVFEVFKLKLYGDLPENYILYADNANGAIEDLKKNLKDMQYYCNDYADFHKISIVDIQNETDIKLENPYVLNS
jgi:hypothetical protein